jgi:predicted PurR-regulated permease PerM
MNDRHPQTENGSAPPPEHPPAPHTGEPDDFTRRVLTVVGIVALAVGAGLVFVHASDVFFLFFLSALLAILFRSLGNAVAWRLRIAQGWGLLIVLTLTVALLVGGGAMLGTAVAVQVERLATDIPKAVEQTRQYLRERPWGREVLDYVPLVNDLFAMDDTAVLTDRISRFFSTTLGFVGNVVVVVFVTLYFAVDPKRYVHGSLYLLPRRHRPRGRAVLEAVGFTLKWFLIGRLLAMIAVGIMVGIGLSLLGIEQYLALALLAALLDVVPFFGPLIAAVPAILIALMIDPITALWVTGLYLVAQSIESYLLTPLVQQGLIHLPPVLTMAAIVLAGALFGVVAILVATPLMAMVLVIVKMLYVEDVLGEEMNVEGVHKDGGPVSTIAVDHSTH